MDYLINLIININVCVRTIGLLGSSPVELHQHQMQSDQPLDVDIPRVCQVGSQILTKQQMFLIL